MENRSRHLLLWIACALAMLLVLSRLIGSSADGSPSDIDTQIAELRRKLAEVSTGDDVDLPAERIEASQPYFDSPISARQQHLEALIGSDFISSVDPGQPTKLAEWPAKRVVSFHLKLRLPLEDLCEVLARLDADPQPMRVDYVRIRPMDEVDRTLGVDLTVSTLADADDGDSAPAPGDPPVARADVEVPVTLREPTTRPVRKNIFFPVGLIARSPAPRPDMVVRPFTLIGVETNEAGSRALLSLTDTGDTVWVEPGMSIAGATLAAIGPDAASFQIGRETAWLSVGQSSGRLMLGKRTFRNGCTLLGVLRTDDRRLGLVRFAGRTDYVHLAVGDVLHGGKIVAFGDDSMIMDYGGYDEVVRVGQDSDSLPYPE